MHIHQFKYKNENLTIANGFYNKQNFYLIANPLFRNPYDAYRIEFNYHCPFFTILAENFFLPE